MRRPGWGTWRAGSPAAVVHPPTGAEVALGAFSAARGAFTPFPYDPETVSLGPRLPDGRYAELELEHAGSRVRVSWARAGPDALVGELEVLEAAEWGLRLWFLVALGLPDGDVRLERPEAPYREPPLALARGPGGAAALLPAERPVAAHLYEDWTEAGGELERAGYYYRPPTRERGRWAVLRLNAAEPRLRWAVAAAGDDDGARAAATGGPGGAGDASAAARARTPGTQAGAGDASAAARAAARRALEGADEALAGARRAAAADPAPRAAVRDVVGWNTVWHPEDRRPYTAATRAWVARRFGGSVVWLVDAWVHVLLAGHLGDWDAARWNVEAALGNRTEAGSLAALRSPLTFWEDRSHPPLGALAVWDLHARTGDRALLERAYPVLRDAHEWWFHHRDPDGDGLLEHGSSPVGDGHFVHTRLAAMNESAMDNSPVHDLAAFDPERHVLDAADVGLNSLVVLEGELLAGMADALGRDEGAGLRERAAALAARVRERLWDPERAAFANRGWDGRFAPSLAPTSFYPLLAGAASPEQAGALVRGHLLDPERFWTPVPIAGTPAGDPAARDNTYWRGRAWPLFNLLVHRGLRRYGFDDEAAALAERGWAAFERHWRGRRSWENLNQVTGEGGDSPDADPFYTWGAVLAALPDLEVVDLTPWDGLAFGAPGGGEARAELRTARGAYACALGPRRTELRAPDGLELRAALRGRFRRLEWTSTGMSVLVPAREAPVALEVGAPVEAARLDGSALPLPGEGSLQLPPGRPGRLELRLPASGDARSGA